MFYLIMAILLNVVLSALFKLFPRYKVDAFQAIVFNYGVCVVTGSLFLGHVPYTASAFHAPWLPWAIRSSANSPSTSPPDPPTLSPPASCIFESSHFHRNVGRFSLNSSCSLTSYLRIIKYVQVVRTHPKMNPCRNVPIRPTITSCRGYGSSK
jgi:hypothetical protein